MKIELVKSLASVLALLFELSLQCTHSRLCVSKLLVNLYRWIYKQINV